MKEIKRIEIKGFQSHVNTDILMSPGVNVIVGPSDAGKSAIFRAIKWVLRNEPRGDAFINNKFKKDNKPCVVTLHLSDGISVARIKGSSLNQYVVYESDKQERIFSGFGNEIPVEVLSALGIQPIDFGENIRIDLNFSNQLDGPFLLKETPRTPAVVFGHLVGLDQVDAATRLTSKQKRANGDNAKNAESNVIKFQERIDELPDSEKAKTILNQVGALLQQEEKLSSEVDSLTALNLSLTVLDKRIADINSMLPNKENVNKIKDALMQFEETAQQHVALAQHQVSIIRSTTRINEITRVLPTARKINFIKKSYEEIISTTNSYYDLVALQEKIRSVAMRILQIVRRHDAAKDAGIIKSKIDNLEKLKLEIKRLTELQYVFETSGTKIKTAKDNRIKLNQLYVTEIQKLENAIKTMSICPLSGGEFFNSCKELLKRVQ